ncbi:ANR family transcriptional regulator [Edwardsiella tarda]|uniref:ANR family transcriptional regulator n=1 Tax=Edwardsiella tarda TaxID=636 RepID=UPI0028607F57|nr:ANR family transcriptional regulator [Escherichia coli]
MMKIKESEAKNTYAAYALGATRAEWRKDYQTAAPLWEKAAASPASVRCREWAVLRAEFCHNAAQRKWGAGHESQAV